MSKLTSLFAAALFATACGKSSTDDPAQPYRDALPTSSSVRLGVPAASSGGNGGNGGALTASSASTPSTASDPLYQSEYAVMSYWTAVSLNLGVWSVLNLVHAISLYPPTRCDASSCTWGPWLGDDRLNFWKLHVVKDGGTYAYALSARTAADPGAPWVDLLTGEATPSAPRHGKGSFLLDFDAQDRLQHEASWVKTDHGQLRVQHDDTAGLVVQATFLNALDKDPRRPHRIDAVYRFDETGTDGDLQIQLRDLATDERIGLRTRWKHDTGAGRADARYDGFDVAHAPVSYDATQCWAGAASGWAETYDTTTWPVSGSPSACVFDTRPDPLLTVALP
jgi:hypothetical protein